MQNNNNIEKDDFGLLMKQRLENAQIPVDENLWAGIEQRLPKKNKTVPFWWWTAISGVAAIAFIMFTIKPFDQYLPHQTETTVTSENSNLKQNDENMAIVSKPDETHAVQTVTAEQISKIIDKTFNKSRSRSTANKFLTRKQTIDTTGMEKEILQLGKNNKIDNVIADERSTVTQPIAEIETSAENTQDIAANNKVQREEIKHIDQLPDLQPDADKTYTPPKHELDKPLFAAAFSTGGGADFGGIKNMEPEAMNDKIVNAETKYMSIMAPKDFLYITHLPPVSFGLKINKEFSKNLSIESGIIYTYMSSIYKDALMQKVNADLNLHYVGIPVNILLKISQHKKWQIYLAGGGMVEKGIRSVYNQRTYVGNYEYTTVAKTKIEGFQYSVSGATGFSYQIFNHISFYAEPSITYYFENNQPMSARTEQPLIVGLNAGLRFGL